MPSTPIYGFPYPALSDAPNGPAQFQALAEAVEADLQSVSTTLTADIAAIEALFSVPIARVRQTVVQTLTTGVYGIITFTTEDFDSHSGHSTAVNTGRYTVPSSWAGVYKFTAGVAFAANATGSRGCRWAKNGSALAATSVMYNNTGAGTAARVASATLYANLIVGDYIELEGFQDTGGNLDTFSSGDVASFMNVEFIRTL